MPFTDDSFQEHKDCENPLDISQPALRESLEDVLQSKNDGEEDRKESEHGKSNIWVNTNSD